jgi:tetratricopeptide (TPR) repeat protein
LFNFAIWPWQGWKVEGQLFADVRWQAIAWVVLENGSDSLAAAPQANPQRQENNCKPSPLDRNSLLASTEIDNCYALAAQELRQRDFQSASSILEEIIQAKPAFGDAHQALGVAKANLEDLDGAIQEFRTALRLNPKSVATLYGLADALTQQHQYDAASFYIRQGIALTASADQTFSLQLVQARVYDETQQSTDAIRLLRSLVAQQPASQDAEFYLGNAYAHARLYREAAAAYAQCLSLDPENDVASLSVAKALVLSGQFEAALLPARGYVRRHPDD